MDGGDEVLVEEWKVEDVAIHDGRGCRLQPFVRSKAKQVEKQEEEIGF